MGELLRLGAYNPQRLKHSGTHDFELKLNYNDIEQLIRI